MFLSALPNSMFNSNRNRRPISTDMRTGRLPEANVAVETWPVDGVFRPQLERFRAACYLVGIMPMKVPPPRPICSVVSSGPVLNVALHARILAEGTARPSTLESAMAALKKLRTPKPAA